MSRDGFWETVRGSIIGSDAVAETCFGPRRLTYADYTASGRAVTFIEDYLRDTLELYANTHTDDDVTGRTTTARLEQAERTIKRLVNAGDDYALITLGAGTTGAVERLQKILGLYVAPASRDRLHADLEAVLGKERARALGEGARVRHPVVFVGPYEHHSNELSWRETGSEVVEVELDHDGLFDLEDLERKVSAPEHAGRFRIGAFSAASNVTGIITPVYEVARILHRHGCLAVFDFAALAPYRRIDVRRDEQVYFDAVYFSPHKFLGGPGSAGVLVLRRALYRHDLPPTFAGGGTVDFVNWTTQDYSADLETREKAGTPGILQTMRAALAMELKERLGEEAIERREGELIRKAMERLRRTGAIEVVGNQDPENRIAILSLVVRAPDGFLHPRFVTQLLNDLFGIQSRAGCLCAGPYGHRLLGIDRSRSEAFRRAIHDGRAGVKPGWTRVGFHFLLTDEELAFICDAIVFVAEHGKLFLPLYELDLASGSWRNRAWRPPHASFGLAEIVGPEGTRVSSRAPGVAQPRGSYLAQARRLARELETHFDESMLRCTERELVPFLYVHASARSDGRESGRSPWRGAVSPA